MKPPRYYVHTTSAWYYRQLRTALGKSISWVDEVFFYTREPYGEMAMRWYDHSDEGTLWSPHLEVFIQSAEALWFCQGLLQDLATISGNREDGVLSPEKFCHLLEKHGFVDGTAYTYEMSYPSDDHDAAATTAE